MQVDLQPNGERGCERTRSILRGPRRTRTFQVRQRTTIRSQRAKEDAETVGSHSSTIHALLRTEQRPRRSSRKINENTGNQDGSGRTAGRRRLPAGTVGVDKHATSRRTVPSPKTFWTHNTVNIACTPPQLRT